MLKLDKLLKTVNQYKASDLLLEAGAKPCLRINGDIVAIKDHPVLTREATEEYIFELLSDKQKQLFDSGEDLDFSVSVPEIANFRVNVFKQRNGIGGVFRLIAADIPKFEELGLPQAIRQIVDMNSGLVLVTGPTGCGKSTTLASIINEINQKYPKHIITIEDPVEYIHKPARSIINQREVGPHCKNFAQALRSSLRESPDVILVGEMRDLETISLAITAAETGHLVLSTVHTSGTAKTISRIVDVFPSDQQNQIKAQLAEILKAIIWQRLVKTADSKSQVPAVEFMLQNHATANLIRKGATHQIDTVIETSRNEGMQTMKRSLLELATTGKITKEEAMKYLPMEFED
ncbi:MAG: twitching mobility protein Pilt, twitching motility protein PilT [Candidatus Peregrinibacteria bacterium GW2011_GWF2_43_17]|nr:MAG: twitching mobility protein Pilt, twitching motility protein PilT [Candidatus Peregrinibacteria bacterium GW2011_GWF2_43_17]KKT20491.1 MAG: 4-diphosphocytidyl-2C-methyl-D-erythritol kinase [Candidatus Peregrinibacteria bacterium GW2011_GWA2_43_8]HAU40304.1 type IV pili twitching motility protein PilT [Candidatus Peregrinibacteria bacterium]